MENKLQKLQSFKEIKLTPDEKASLRARMAYQMSITPVMPRISWIQKSAQHGLRIVLSTSMFVVFVCGSISVVANSALPGDPLYAFKVNVNEEVKGAFMKTPTAKIAWQKARIETRLNEIQILAQTKTLTEAKQATVEKALDDHVTALNAELTTLGQNDPNTALKTTTDIEATLQAKKAEVLSTPDTSTTPTDTTAQTAALKTIDGAIQKVSDQEVQLLNKEIDSIKIDTQSTPVDTAPAATQTTPTKPVTPSGS
ncbi:MAG: hypothetical protein WCQ32_01745 [bacterium]